MVSLSTPHWENRREDIVVVYIISLGLYTLQYFTRKSRSMKIQIIKLL